MNRVTLPAALTTILALSAAAQSGGFQAGDLYLYNPAFEGLSSTSGAIVRVQPTTGTITMLVDLETSSNGDTMAYDPWRDRLIFFGGLIPNHSELYLCDAAGNLTSLGFGTTSGSLVGRFAPRGDGLIYFRSLTTPGEISYLDAADNVQTLLDAAGAAPYAFPGNLNNVRQLEFHPASNSLVAATAASLEVCPGGLADAVNLYRLDLSADGTRVLSDACFQYDVDPGAGNENPVGLTPGPGGDLLLHVDNNSGATLPRMARVDPGGASASSFASSSSGATSSGAYSQVLGRAIVHDSFSDVLRAYVQGESGAGTVIATGTGAVGGSGESAALVEIVPTSSFGLSATPATISLSAGGSQAWEIALGLAHAGQVHLVVGSLSGWTPATLVGGVPIPLVFDGYSSWTLGHQNSAVLQSTFGVLDGQGGASAAFTLPAGTDPSLVGLVAHHAALAFFGGSVVAATNPVPVELLP